MAKIKFSTGEAAALPKRALELEPEMSELDLRLVFTLAREGEFDESKLDAIAESIGVSRGELDGSLAFLRSVGVLSGGRGRRTKSDGAGEKKSEKKLISTAEMPSYTSDEVARIFAEHKELSDLIDLCQNTLGRVFNTQEANTVLGLRSYLKLEPEYIVSLMAYCSAKGKTAMRYIESMAFSLHDKGIDTPVALDEYLKNKEKYDSEEGYLRRLFGFGDRALTGRERAAFSRWSGEWSMSREMISAAYEITVNAIHEPSVAYADKILEKWHANGVKTPDEIAKTEKKPEAAQTAVSSFDTDDFFEAALRRSYGTGGDNK